jgi:tetratricopeptide (TPR) repeat protein
MQGQVDKMVERFREDPDATIVRRVVNRAVYSDFVQFDPAAIDKMVEQFVTAAPNHPFTPLIHGVVLFRKGDYSAAEEQFARAKELGQNGSWVFHGFRETFQARIAFRQGNFDEALLKFQRISRSFGMRGPKSHKDKLNDSWIDQMAVMILMAEAGKEMSKVFAGKDLTLQQRRLGILSLQAVARRHRFARQHEKFLEATRQALAQLISLVGDRDIASDRQAVMFLVWQQLNADPEFQLPRDEVHAALETLFPASSLALPRVEWSTLKPLDFQSREEVESTIEPDHSIFVGGAHPRQNVYTVRYEVPSGHITGLRLELVRDSRLSSFGPGRNGNGNTHIHNVEFNVHSGGNSASPALKVAGATSAFHSWDGASSRQNRASGMFDDDESTYFDVWPKTGRNHNIVAELAGPVVSADGDQLGVTIECTSERFGFHTVGRFRISATTSTAGLRIQRCWGDVSPQSVSYWSIMAARLMNANQFDKAKPWVERALSDDDPSTAFDWLVAARYYRHAGDQAQADQLHSDAALWASSYRRERSILERLLTSVAPPQSTTKVPGQ